MLLEWYQISKEKWEWWKLHARLTNWSRHFRMKDRDNLTKYLCPLWHYFVAVGQIIFRKDSAIQTNTRPMTSQCTKWFKMKELPKHQGFYWNKICRGCIKNIEQNTFHKKVIKMKFNAPYVIFVQVILLAGRSISC